MPAAHILVSTRTISPSRTRPAWRPPIVLLVALATAALVALILLIGPAASLPSRSGRVAGLRAVPAPALAVPERPFRGR